eukprot:g26598.t1
MPAGIPYIVGNEAAERFSFYGMRAILFVFMTKYLMDQDGSTDVMSDSDATSYIHLFIASAYFFPVIGAIISDWLWGKYKTILTLSLVYCAGHITLALDETRFGLTLGLTLIAIGAGGIKPCVSAHVGDQFGQKNKHLISKVFGWFYFSINLGAFASQLLTPILLSKFGPSVAFGVPGGLMLLATWVFWLGRNKFVHVPPGGAAFLKESFDADGKRAIRNLAVLYVFVAVFWSLFDQTTSRWVSQAESLNRNWLGIEWLSSQIGAANPILILCFIPVFTYVIYPAINRVFPLTPLRKVAIGFFVTVPAFLLPAWIESEITGGKIVSFKSTEDQSKVDEVDAQTTPAADAERWPVRNILDGKTDGSGWLSPRLFEGSGNDGKLKEKAFPLETVIRLRERRAWKISSVEFHPFVDAKAYIQAERAKRDENGDDEMTDAEMLRCQAKEAEVLVVFNKPLETAFHYLVPDGLRDLIGPGRRVKVPFGRGDRLTVGYCVGVGPPPETTRRLKTIDSMIDREPLVSPGMLELTKWIAERYLCGWGQVLQTVVPAGVKHHAGTRTVNVYALAPGAATKLDSRRAEKQQAVIDVLAQSDRALTVGEISEAVGCGTGPINALRSKGLIVAGRERRDTFEIVEPVVEPEEDKVLHADQQVALDAILKVLRASEYRTILLRGVTGSGKTEVYIQAIREAVSYGKQAIVLVPEISLTPQTIRRFRSRFNSVAVLHSHLSDAERHRQWQRIASGSVQVVVGARSAIFAPLPHLGLIVIDEEHETSFKQETVPRYHTREVARRRAEIESIPLILGSATPTLESWKRATDGEDLLLSLPRRVAGLPLPPVVVVDVRNDPHISHGGGIGRALATAMQTALENGGQIILFLNLRGFTPTLWCRACGTAVKCPHCDISLTWHKDRDIALCHSCDFETKAIIQCPECTKPGLQHLGMGTQRLEAEVNARFRKYKCVRMDSDSMRKPGSHDETLSAFDRGEIDILLGTQMIAKGLDFPNVTLVGVINADTVLHQPDIRAAERTFQLISQVAGRTGRGRKGGRVFVQTWSPGEPAILKAAEHDYVGFAQVELQHRRDLDAPPYRHLVRVIFRGPVEEQVRDFAKEFAERLRTASLEMAGVSSNDRQQPSGIGQPGAAGEIRILGPAPAPIAKQKANYRYHLQMSAVKPEAIRDLWRATRDSFPHSGDVEYAADVDPYNMR